MSTFSPALREFLATPDASRRLGPYLCKQPLDKAGTAPVFRAVEEHAGHNLREVAVKVFDIGKAKPLAGGAAPKTDDDDDWQARVIAEARTLCRVQHPNVIRFHTLSTDPRRGLMGLVMELAEGVSVDKRLEDLKPGDERRVGLAVEVGIEIAAALAAAHDAGIVHCNVKPSNVMFSDGTHKLINFGIAATLRHTIYPGERAGLSLDDLGPDAVGKKAATLDTSGDDSGPPLMGTIGYADPICVRTTTPPSASSDLYSLGATLYQILAGDVPALATSRHRGEKKLDAKVLTGEAPPTPVAEVAPFAPAALAKLVDSLVDPSRKARPRSAEAVQRSLERIRSALAGRERSLPAEDRGPFPGLDRYEASDRDVFFGRSAEIAGVLELARSRGLVGIVGVSGSGKSSLTRAGVVPAIEEGALGGWPSKYRSVVVTPGQDLMGALCTALEPILGAKPEEHPEAIVQQLSAAVDAKGEGIVILVDQLEELVTKHTSARDETRLAALELLSRLADAPAGLRVIVAVRRDLLDAVLAVDPHFSRALARGVQLLGPLSGAGWEEVVDQSLEAYGYRFDDADLRRKILDDLKARESAMSLVQFGLARLWSQRDTKNKTIPRSAFDAKGGMRDALENHAEAAVKGLDVPQETLRGVLLGMTTAEGTRDHVELDVLVERLGEKAKVVVFALTKARLVVSEKEGFTFVHDSLLKDWKLLRGWLDNEREDRLLAAHVERDARRWSDAKDPALHWRRGRLAAAMDLWKEARAPLSDEARSFLSASYRDEQRLKLGRWLIGLALVSIVVFGSMFYAKLSRDSAAQARRDADALAAALAEVKALKAQAEENAGEAAASAAMLQELQRKLSQDVAKTMKKVASATSLEGAQKASAELKPQGTTGSQVVALPLDLTGSATGGPKLDTSGPSPSGGGGGGFDQSAIERVVNSRKAGVKRTCLERSANTASSTKVTATLTIAPGGSVQNVSTAGNDPVVGKCIEQQLRTWTFPPPGDVQTVQIPFVFVRQ